MFLFCYYVALFLWLYCLWKPGIFSGPWILICVRHLLIYIAVLCWRPLPVLPNCTHTVTYTVFAVFMLQLTQRYFTLFHWLLDSWICTYIIFSTVSIHSSTRCRIFAYESDLHYHQQTFSLKLWAVICWYFHLDTHDIIWWISLMHFFLKK